MPYAKKVLVGFTKLDVPGLKNQKKVLAFEDLLVNFISNEPHIESVKVKSATTCAFSLILKSKTSKQKIYLLCMMKYKNK